MIVAAVGTTPFNSVVESVNAVNLRYITVSKKYDYFLHVPEAVAL